MGRLGDAIKIKLAAPAVEGKANAALVRFLADHFGVSKSAVVIVRGEKSREKLVEIQGARPGSAFLTELTLDPA